MSTKQNDSDERTHLAVNCSTENIEFTKNKDMQVFIGSFYCNTDGENLAGFLT